MLSLYGLLIQWRKSQSVIIKPVTDVCKINMQVSEGLETRFLLQDLFTPSSWLHKMQNIFAEKQSRGPPQQLHR